MGHQSPPRSNSATVQTSFASSYLTSSVAWSISCFRLMVHSVKSRYRSSDREPDCSSHHADRTVFEHSRGRRPLSAARSWIGSRISNRAPRSLPDAAEIRPLWRSTIILQIASPNPNRFFFDAIDATTGPVVRASRASRRVCAGIMRYQQRAEAQQRELSEQQETRCQGHDDDDALTAGTKSSRTAPIAGPEPGCAQETLGARIGAGRSPR